MRYLYKSYEREYFELWWEYLRRSGKYEDFCLKFGTFEQYEDPDLDYTFNECGDVHRAPLNDFEQWYQFKKLQIRQEGHQETGVQINYLDDLMRERFQEVVNHLSEKLNREPTINEFQDHFFNDFEMMDLQSFVVTPEIYDTSIEVSESVRNWFSGMPVRKTTTVYKKLSEYYKIYDIKHSGIDVKDRIVEAARVGVFDFTPDADMPSYNPDFDEKFDNKVRSFDRGHKKALKIIHNVESNTFPGNYSDKKK